MLRGCRHYYLDTALVKQSVLRYHACKLISENEIIKIIIKCEDDNKSGKRETITSLGNVRPPLSTHALF